MEEKSGGWEKIILSKKLGKGRAQSLSHEAEEWQYRRLGGSLPRASTMRTSQWQQWHYYLREVLKGCLGTAGESACITVMLWNVFHWEQVLAQGTKASQCCPKSCFVPSGAAEGSRWQPSLLVWFSWLVECSALSVCNRYREFLEERNKCSELFNWVPSTLGCQVRIRHKHILPLCYLVLFLIALWKRPPA